MLKYAVSCSNSLFRLLHWRGLWLQPGDSNYSAMACQGMTVSCFMLVLWKLSFFSLNSPFEWLMKWNLYPRKPTAVLPECAMRRGGTFSTCVQSCIWHRMKGGLSQLVYGDYSWNWCAWSVRLKCQGAADRGNHNINPLSFSLRFLRCRSLTKLWLSNFKLLESSNLCWLH